MGEPDGSVPTNFPIMSVALMENGALISILESQFKETRFLVPNNILDQIVVAHAGRCSVDVMKAILMSRKNAETSRLEIARALTDPAGIRLETKNVR